MNAIDLLIEDHERVKDLLTRLTESTERAVKTRTELLSKLEMEVTIHTQLEEQILYPAYKEAGVTVLSVNPVGVASLTLE